MKIAIFGYGNLGRGVAAALPRCPDMEGIGIYTRRRPEEIHTDAGLPVFPAEEIYRRVWEDVPLNAAGAIAVHIRHLREKLEINPSEPRYIKVVWGKGYKMEGGVS